MANETKKEEPKKSWLDGLIGGLGNFASSDQGKQLLGGLLAQAVTGAPQGQGFLAGATGVQDVQNQAFQKQQIALKNEREQRKQDFDEKYKTDYLSYLNKTLQGKQGTTDADEIELATKSMNLAAKGNTLDTNITKEIDRRVVIDDLHWKDADSILNAINERYPEKKFRKPGKMHNEKKTLKEIKASNPQIWYEVVGELAGKEY